MNTIAQVDLELQAFDAFMAELTIAMMEHRASLSGLGDALNALAIAALVELGTSYYTAAPHITPDLYEAIWRAMDAGQLAFRMDVVGSLPHAIGRGVQVVHGNRRYEWAVQS